MASNTAGRSPAQQTRPSQNAPVPTQQPAKTVELSFQKLLAQYQRQIAVALPQHMSADRMIRVALTAYNQTPALRECDPVTIIAAIIQSSQLGLEPGINVLGHAYLVPFRNYTRGRREAGNALVRGGRDNPYIMEAQLIVGYKGYLELAWRSGRCQKFGANLVHAYDTFSLSYEPEPVMKHTPKFIRTQGDLLIPVTAEERGPIVGVYGFVQQKGGEPNVEFLSRDELERIRDTFSQFGKADKDNPDGKGVWFEHFPVMCRKTGVRNVSRWAPLSPEIQKAVGLDDRAESGLSQEIAEALDLVATNTERGYVYQPQGNGNGKDDTPPADDAGQQQPSNGSQQQQPQQQQTEPQRQQPTQPTQTQQQQKPEPPAESGRALSPDDFSAEDYQLLQANLRAAGMNRPQIMQWIGQQTDVNKAMSRADAWRYDAEQQEGAK